ncbi:LPS export ABC transporter periplasmic protein LptC [Cardinium endosymbiont of Tipula unca]|uniref:LPS export ABC transporter periplasmic protein LptC n=1 Tax=Cardinium endosymbiont of Tipula unca TaxID=3066216 RepID=UPI0030D4ECB9
MTVDLAYARMHSRALSNTIKAILCYCFSTVGIYTSAHAQNQPYDETPILETTQFELLSTEKGALTLTVKALKMCQYKNGNTVLKGNIEIIIIERTTDQDQAEGPTSIQANKLSYDKMKKSFILEGNILITNPQKKIKITTEQLSYSMEEELIFTDSPIKIVHKKDILQGIGLRATKDLKKYTIGGPNGMLDIAQ